MMLAVLLVAAAAAQCAPVQLSVEGNSKTFIARFARNSTAFTRTSANFANAYAKACGEGLLKAKPLISARSADRKHLFLVNAPDANVASIYSDKGRTVLEYWFVGHDGKTHAPGADELHEAIYCAVHGATNKADQESGRCLPD